MCVPPLLLSHVYLYLYFCCNCICIFIVILFIFLVLFGDIYPFLNLFVTVVSDGCCTTVLYVDRMGWDSISLGWVRWRRAPYGTIMTLSSIWSHMICICFPFLGSSPRQTWLSHVRVFSWEYSTLSRYFCSICILNHTKWLSLFKFVPHGRAGSSSERV